MNQKQGNETKRYLKYFHRNLPAAIVCVCFGGIKNQKHLRGKYLAKAFAETFSSLLTDGNQISLNETF